MDIWRYRRAPVAGTGERHGCGGGGLAKGSVGAGRWVVVCAGQEGALKMAPEILRAQRAWKRCCCHEREARRRRCSARKNPHPENEEAEHMPRDEMAKKRWKAAEEIWPAARRYEMFAIR